MNAHEPLPDYYMNRDARVEKMDLQGLEAVWLFPTLGVLYEELLKHDTEAVKTQFTAFNRWVEEDWGCNYRERIFAAPYISLCDVNWACQQLEWALSGGARVVCMRGYCREYPGELFKRHIWINPFWEDDVNEVAEYMGVDRVIFGSDWPHIEGMPSPLDYLKDLEQFDDRETQLIMRDNARELNTPQPL
jgi:hypothetical protein